MGLFAAGKGRSRDGELSLFQEISARLRHLSPRKSDDLETQRHLVHYTINRAQDDALCVSLQSY